MADSLIPRNEYTKMLPSIINVRDAIDGEYAVKFRQGPDGTPGTWHLPNPSETDTKSAESKARYARYKAGAEFDEFPSQTLYSILGRMAIDKSGLGLPSSVDYLEQDADGDGQALTGLMEYVASEVLQVKWVALVCEYQGLSGLDIDQLSKADADQLQPRSTIKAYNRESIIDWEFERRNGVMQLTYIVLRYVGSELDQNSRVRTPVRSDLVLGLDEDGNYYQQKIVDGEEGPKEPVTINGVPLKWLPVVFIADQEMKPGKLPEPMGYLGPIVNAAYARYVKSAYYAEAMYYLAPTMFTKGWRAGDVDTFKEANNGREFIETGAGRVNNLPNDVTVEVVSASAECQFYENYLTYNEKKIRALGGVFKTDDTAARTATEAGLDAAERVAKLQTVADSMERGFTRAVLYCAMFEGTYKPDQIESHIDDVAIDIPRDFAKPKLTPEEVDRIINLVMSGLMTIDQAVRSLVEGGWHIDDAETVLAELQVSGPAPASDEPPVVPA
jgi:hypothetical protein